MDLLNKLANQGNNDGYYSKQPAQQQDSQSGSGGLLDKLQSMANGSPKREEKPSGSSSLVDKLHGMVGGGPESEKQEDLLDKGKAPVLQTSIRRLMRRPACHQALVKSVRDRELIRAPGRFRRPGRHRLGAGAHSRAGPAGQRERHRAGQGQDDCQRHPGPVQEGDRQGVPHQEKGRGEAERACRVVLEQVIDPVMIERTRLGLRLHPCAQRVCRVESDVISAQNPSPLAHINHDIIP